MAREAILLSFLKKSIDMTRWQQAYVLKEDYIADSREKQTRQSPFLTFSPTTPRFIKHTTLSLTKSSSGILFHAPLLLPIFHDVTDPVLVLSSLEFFFHLLLFQSKQRYGNISPITRGGRLLFIFYAIFGIPLCLVLLAGCGGKLTQTVKKLKPDQKPGVRKALWTILFVILGLVLFFFLPAIGFMLLERWSYNDSLYYAFVTLTTIGFGDFVPAQDWNGRNRWLYKIILAIWIFVGLAWVASVISMLQDLFGECLQKASKGDKNSGENNEENGMDNSEPNQHDPERTAQTGQKKETDRNKSIKEMPSVNL
ncbi:hypothetical protein CAPTEDRAFT_204873 [Capitella teleta]|uniref:Potassium channel domain-containing protein n=1 Tax=Capitella teleta TaxID=283909 RepID=R7TJ22_CAPTE|nr:hypothetical protein CAPTEDRAFT_204873 [Capitella teleta]|eukprot:ELT93492.1 hypothetical protein CAPTEDRAFT_204873 [Capitella teleta]